jgi:hypothetical protein
VNRITTPCVLQGRTPIAVVAQLVEQLIRNQQVSGSNPLNGSRIEVPPKPPETGGFAGFRRLLKRTHHKSRGFKY